MWGNRFGWEFCGRKFPPLKPARLIASIKEHRAGASVNREPLATARTL